MDGLFKKYQPDNLLLVDKARLGIMPDELPLHILAEAWALERANWIAEDAEPLIMPILSALVAAIECGDLEANPIERDSSNNKILHPYRRYHNPAAEAQASTAINQAIGARFIGIVSDKAEGWEWVTYYGIDSPRILKPAFLSLLIACNDQLPAFWFSPEERSQQRAKLAGIAKRQGNKLAKEEAIRIANERWRSESEANKPATLIGTVAQEITGILGESLELYGRGKNYPLKTIKDWIKPHAPQAASRPGRPTKNIRL